MRELDHPHLTNPAQHLDLRDTEHAVVVLASVGCVHTNLAKVIKPETLDQLNRQGEFRRAGIDQCLTLDLFSLLLWRKVTVLPVPHLHHDPKHAHAHLRS